MEDTSFAIHPEKEKKERTDVWHDIGNMQTFTQVDAVYKFVCDNGYVNIRFYRSDIVRIVMHPFYEPTMETSFALVKEPENVRVKAGGKQEEVELRSDTLSVQIKRHPFRIAVYDRNGRLLVSEGRRGMTYTARGQIMCVKDMRATDHFYGFGEKTSYLDKRGEKMTMWNSDVFAPHNPETDPLYQSIPYFMTIREGYAHGIFFDNTFKTVFDMKSANHTYSFWAEGGELDYYVLAGPTPKDVLEQYTTLTGRMELPPKWAIGYHQSRYSYQNEAEVRDLVEHFQRKNIPLDAIHLDIHHMDGYRVFTFDRTRFPHPQRLLQDLEEAGIHAVPIVDPGVKKDPEYPVYQEGIRQNCFCRYVEGAMYFGDVWPGSSAFPDFTSRSVRSWWGEKQKFYTDIGVEGIWNDMNEPAVFNETKTMDPEVIHDNDGNPKTHRELHNVYGLFMAEATFHGLKKHLRGKRPFVLTRAGYAGVQRYAAVWTGDNRSFWEHLQMMMPMCMNLGMSGVAFSGSDVGGFAHDATGELLARWTQAGAFTPYFRNHSNLGTVRQEPWAFGEEIEEIVRKYIQLRYKWLPYLYTLFREAYMTGAPVMRPLVMEYPNDTHTWNLSDQFLLGPYVMIAPITTPSTFHRVVYLPEGTWYDYWTDEKIKGGRHIMVEADLATLPMFIKEGAILPEAEAKSSTKTPDDAMTFHIYPTEGETEYAFYEDDGATIRYQEGHYLEQRIRCRFAENVVTITVEDTVNAFTPPWKKVVFTLHHTTPDMLITWNGKRVVDAFFDADKKRAVFEVVR